ncbi:TetR/AcrR family transcriptional regulator [Nonomuraea insulae]|uniref:TetR/AcrR family transcriptional regulator n=1 Tax=Nonomuraea insulae TaxID=1616787 RepID=A0ABW1D6S7_9ACTN
MPAERRRSPRGQGDQLRREILDAVNRLLITWGSAEKLTIRAVAKEVGVAAPSIYLHFSDKLELVWSALADKYDDLAAQMAAADANAGDADPRERLRAQARAYCQFALDNPGHYRLMFEVRQPPAEMSRIGLHPARRVSGRFRAGFTRCQEAGEMLSLPVEQAALTLWAGLHGLVALNHSLFLEASVADLTLNVADGLVASLVAGPDGAAHLRPVATDTVRQIRALMAEDDSEAGQ